MLGLMSACGGAEDSRPSSAEASSDSSDSPDNSEGSTDSAGSLAAGDYEILLDWEGEQRLYLLYVPEATGPLPAIVALHGGGGAAHHFKQQIELDELADREGFVVAYPDGTGPLPKTLHTWNAGSDCCGSAGRQDVDDSGFIKAIVADMERILNMDSDRVYLAGHSNDAMMSYRVASEAPELFAGVVAIGGAARDGHVPSIPVPLLHIHSLDDPQALYAGGSSLPFPDTDILVEHFDVRSGIDAWAAAAGCGAEPVAGETVTGAGDIGPQSATLLAWPGCQAEVAHLQMAGIGHAWPGVEHPDSTRLGAHTTLVDANQELWEFLSRQRRG